MKIIYATISFLVIGGACSSAFASGSANFPLCKDGKHPQQAAACDAAADACIKFIKDAGGTNYDVCTAVYYACCNAVPTKQSASSAGAKKEGF